MRLDEIAHKESGNLPAAGEDAVDNHIQPNLARHLLSHVAVIAHTAVNQSHLALFPWGRFSGVQYSPVPAWRKSCGS